MSVANFSVNNAIQHLKSQVKRLDKEIAKLMKGILQTLTSIKGIGDVFAAFLSRLDLSYSSLFNPLFII
jgi:hypothetical protein